MSTRDISFHVGKGNQMSTRDISFHVGKGMEV